MVIGWVTWRVALGEWGHLRREDELLDELPDLAEPIVKQIRGDQVAADACGATLLGKTANDLPYIHLAAAAGCGTADYESLSPVRLHVD